MIQVNSWKSAIRSILIRSKNKYAHNWLITTSAFLHSCTQLHVIQMPLGLSFDDGLFALLPPIPGDLTYVPDFEQQRPHYYMHVIRHVNSCTTHPIWMKFVRWILFGHKLIEDNLQLPIRVWNGKVDSVNSSAEMKTNLLSRMTKGRITL